MSGSFAGPQPLPVAYPATVNPPAPGPTTPADRANVPPVVDLVIEVPRFGFVKRGWGERIDFVSPLPCPYNYGAVPTHLGLEGDLLDAIVLGPRLPRGTRLRLPAWGAVTMADRGLVDDKLICSAYPPSAAEIARVLRFFRFYARCKGLLNVLRRRPGRNACDGLRPAESALARARPLTAALDRSRGRPPVPF